MKHVKIGVGFGLWRLGMPTPETIVHGGRKGRGMGLDSFWLSDHLLSPSPELDVVATLAVLASRTSRIKLGPSVLLLNLRHPLTVAKSFATLDYYSHGRMVMAVGTGANLADYAATGIALETRGRRLDEGVDVLRKVWTQSNVSSSRPLLQFRQRDARAASGAAHQQRLGHDRHLGRRQIGGGAAAHGADGRRLLRVLPDAGGIRAQHEPPSAAMRPSTGGPTRVSSPA